MINLGLAYNARFSGELYHDGQYGRNAALGGWCASYIDGRNPTLLKYAKNSGIHFAHMNKYGGLIQVNFFSCIYKGKKYPYYLSLISRSVDDIPDTRSAWVDDGDSIPENGEINYHKMEQFSQKEIGVRFSTIRNIRSYIIGINFKPSLTSLAEYWAYGISGDVSVLMEPVSKMQVGMRLEDVIGIKSWDSNTLETISPLLMGTLSCQYSTLRIGLEAGSRLGENRKLNYHVGIEFNQQKLLFFRVGTSHINQFTMGLGIQFSFVEFNYAYLYPNSDTPFEASHIISAGINLKEINGIKDKITP